MKFLHKSQLINYKKEKQKEDEIKANEIMDKCVDRVSLARLMKFIIIF